MQFVFDCGNGFCQHFTAKHFEAMDAKERMIEYHLKGRDIYDGRVLRAMHSINRELFVPDDVKHLAYDDCALPIGGGQTISQPYIVAFMAQALQLKPADKLLEVGSGCGYNAAVLSRLVSHVYSVEIIDWLAEKARRNLLKAGVHNVSVKHANGYKGWPEKGPFDKIMLTAAAREVPEVLKKQLKTGGKILAPLGSTMQELTLLEKFGENDFGKTELIHVRFVPMTSETEK